jgi:hypothetical protein
MREMRVEAVATSLLLLVLSVAGAQKVERNKNPSILKPPDLIVSHFEVGDGKTMRRVRVRVQNVGGKAAKACSLTVFIAKVKWPEALAGGYEVKEVKRKVPALAAQQGYGTGFDIPKKEGEYDLIPSRVLVDSDNEVPELNEENNSRKLYNDAQSVSLGAAGATPFSGGDR